MGAINSAHIFSRLSYWHWQSCLISLLFSSHLQISTGIASFFVPLKYLAHRDFWATTVIWITNLESRLFQLGQEKHCRDCVSLLLEEWITASPWEEAVNSSCGGHTPTKPTLLWCLLKTSLLDRTHLASNCLTEITSTPLHLTYAKRNDKNISTSDMARCLVTYRWLKALVASDIVEHAKSLTQLHDLAQREKCLSVVALIPHWVFPDGSRCLFLLLRVPRCNMQQHSVLITFSIQHLHRGCGNDHNAAYGLQCY